MGLQQATVTPALVRAYLATFQGSQPAAAGEAGVAIPVIKRALHGEHLDDDQKLRLYTAARKRMGAAKVDTLLGSRPQPLAIPASPVLVTVAGIAAPAELRVTVPAPGEPARLEMLRCKRCGEDKPADLEHFLPKGGRGRRVEPRAMCRQCIGAVLKEGGERWRRGLREAATDGAASQRGEAIVVDAVLGGSEGQLPVSQQLLALAAAVEQLEQQAARAGDSAQRIGELEAENARLRSELAQLEAFRSNLAALLGPRS